MNSIPQGEPVAESERLSSDPLNLLVNTSVGMWLNKCKCKQCEPFYARIAFLHFWMPDQTGDYDSGALD
jgi:hypothetical protein